MKTMQIHPTDNVAVALTDIAVGDGFAAEAVPAAHKISLCQIAKGEPIIKYGHPIGVATANIPAGHWVHMHNVATLLGGVLKYEYRPNLVSQATLAPVTFNGYRRPDGRVGVRNEIWILPTVGCVNRNAELIAVEATRQFGILPNIDGIYACPHPYGCSQMGEDHRQTQEILANIVRHPNAGGVLVLGLGCENNHIEAFQKGLGEWDPERVKFIDSQSVDDEITAGVEAVGQLAVHAEKTFRSACPVSDLVIGLKCGGSDAFSGITANPLVGRISDRVIAMGGSAVLTEVPEMFGAETLLMARAQNPAVFQAITDMINDFKRYYQLHNQVVYENPSPGNKQGGITTLEDKSLGCIQKGGSSTVMDVLPYVGRVKAKGLSLQTGPGNDLVAVTALAAAGCQLILFTTGRGTPLGTLVPVIKIATNEPLFRKKNRWMDFNAGRLLSGTSMDHLAEELFELVLSTASGAPTKSEGMGSREFTIFKCGVTL
ncbi:MAG: UxaA family hydrolase [Negativicutes bacterium]